MGSIRKILALLDPQERRSAAGLLALIVLMAFIEMLGTQIYQTDPAKYYSSI